MKYLRIITISLFIIIISTSYLHSQSFEYETYEIVNQYQQDEGEFFLVDSLLLKNKKEQIKSIEKKMIIENFLITNIYKQKEACKLLYTKPEIYQIDKNIYVVEFGREAENFIGRKSGLCGGLYILDIDFKTNKIKILKEFPWIITSDDSTRHYSFVGRIRSENLIVIKRHFYIYPAYEVYQLVNKELKTYKDSIPIGFNKVNEREYFIKSPWRIEWPEKLYSDYVNFVTRVKNRNDIDEFFANFDENNFQILNLSNKGINLNDLKKVLREYIYKNFNPYIAYYQALDNQCVIRYPSHTIYIEKNNDKFRILKINRDM